MIYSPVFCMAFNLKFYWCALIFRTVRFSCFISFSLLSLLWGNSPSLVNLRFKYSVGFWMIIERLSRSNLRKMVSEPQMGIERATFWILLSESSSSMVGASHRSSEDCGFDPRLELRNRFPEVRAQLDKRSSIIQEISKLPHFQHISWLVFIDENFL